MHVMMNQNVGKFSFFFYRFNIIDSQVYRVKHFNLYSTLIQGQLTRMHNIVRENLAGSDG